MIYQVTCSGTCKFYIINFKEKETYLYIYKLNIQSDLSCLDYFNYRSREFKNDYIL